MLTVIIEKEDAETLWLYTVDIYSSRMSYFTSEVYYTLLEEENKRLRDMLNRSRSFYHRYCEHVAFVTMPSLSGGLTAAS